jgi:pyruvate/2-oxoglutarate/acetoin dehydrogenase E1 component/TPP-dependent pyruvate/acetoin dehydrogenase alpha subunit
MIYEAKDTEIRDVFFDQEEVVRDYRLAFLSRQVSRIGRREALSGKAKFGIFGDGKELPQIALSKVFQPGDFRSGYYRDQTLMFALEIITVQQFFAQLYAHADLEAEPSSAGRSMTAHFASRFLDQDGSWRSQVNRFNVSADLSPTGSQMPRLVGLGYASRLYRELEELNYLTDFSRNGSEVAFGTIGNATCSEGIFWESVNAIGVLKCPVVLSIWDDGYGISVPNEHQITKQNISDLLRGFQREPESTEGFDVHVVKGWDYPGLIDTYRRASEIARRDHIPSIIHVIEVTQPQGHSSSGSHERYKSAERLDWEQQYDCLTKMRQWMLNHDLATADELDQIERETTEYVENVRIRAWEAFVGPIRHEANQVGEILEKECVSSGDAISLQRIRQKLLRTPVIMRRNILSAVQEALILLHREDSSCRRDLVEIRNRMLREGQERYNTHLHSQSSERTAGVSVIKPVYNEDSPLIPGFEILNKAFDAILAREPRFIAFGEDVGYLGDVNQGFAGLQAKYGDLRVSDTGIREATIIGQAIGMALRGLRPLAEIQYLDYILYGLQILSDDLATLHWRTKGGQKAPVIIRTRGHRLEGIWHSGSMMAGIIHLLRGVHVLVPRNMTQAVGFYNTLLRSDEPGLVVEVLNGYRLRERLPVNIGELTVPIGIPELLKRGDDITLVTYGALCRITLQAAQRLSQVGIHAEVIDVQSLLPFDSPGIIVESLKKTGRIVFIDEDVPGGTTAYMMQEVIEKQGGFWWLDSEPRTLSAQPHRPAYGSDGDYWSKPNVEGIFDLVYEIMNEVDPANFPGLYN